MNTSKMVYALLDAVDKLLSQFNGRLEALEVRLAEVECRPALDSRRVWQSGEIYRRGDFVTFDCSLWHCNVPTAEKPGTSAPGWQLAVK